MNSHAVSHKKDSFLAVKKIPKPSSKVLIFFAIVLAAVAYMSFKTDSPKVTSMAFQVVDPANCTSNTCTNGYMWRYISGVKACTTC
ncbi:hypothetical protein [Methylomicrobium lacus]|uniref:hypothetical protein n=1 Tax=Methylomicrobium lacus TaxID=136992 RepID=UPI0035A819FD